MFTDNDFHDDEFKWIWTSDHRSVSLAAECLEYFLWTPVVRLFIHMSTQCVKGSFIHPWSDSHTYQRLNHSFTGRRTYVPKAHPFIHKATHLRLKNLIIHSQDERTMCVSKAHPFILKTTDVRVNGSSIRHYVTSECHRFNHSSTHQLNVPKAVSAIYPHVTSTCQLHKGTSIHLQDHRLTYVSNAHLFIHMPTQRVKGSSTCQLKVSKAHPSIHMSTQRVKGSSTCQLKV